MFHFFWQHDWKEEQRQLYEQKRRYVRGFQVEEPFTVPITMVLQKCACGAMRTWEFVGHLPGKGKEAEMFKNCKYCSKPAEGKCEICGAPICPDHTEYARYLVICTPCKDKEARAS